MKAIVLNVTSACNFHCKTCLREYRNPEHLSMDLIKKHADEMIALDYKTFSITGGEPCFYKHFEELIEFARQKGARYNLVTNGSLPHKYDFVLETHLGLLEYIAVSIDGADEQTHDENRMPGSYKKALASLDYFKSKGAPTVVVCVLTKKNQNQIEDMIRLCIAHNVGEIRFSSAIATESNKDLVLCDNEKVECLRQILKLRNTYRMNINWCSALRAGEGVDFCNALNFLSALSINPKGELVICCDTIRDGAVIGSLKEKSFMELYELALKEQARMKAIRARSLKTWGEGFNTCEFCNKCLKDKIA